MKRLVVAILFLLIQPAAASIIVTGNAAPPTSNLIVSHSVAINNFAEPWRWISNTGNNHRDVGQSFLVPGSRDVTFDAVTLWAREVGSSALGSPYTFEIWTVSDQFDGIGDLLLHSQAGTLPAAGLSPNTYWTFNIDDVGLSAGGRYAFMLSFTTGPDANRSVNFVEDFNSGYAQGRWLARDGTPTNWGTITNDAVFFVQGLIVPEPSTFALLGLGAIGLAIRARRRRAPA